MLYCCSNSAGHMSEVINRRCQGYVVTVELGCNVGTIYEREATKENPMRTLTYYYQKGLKFPFD